MLGKASLTIMLCVGREPWRIRQTDGNQISLLKWYPNKDMVEDCMSTNEDKGSKTLCSSDIRPQTWLQNIVNCIRIQLIIMFSHAQSIFSMNDNSCLVFVRLAPSWTPALLYSRFQQPQRPTNTVTKDHTFQHSQDPNPHVWVYVPVCSCI